VLAPAAAVVGLVAAAARRPARAAGARGRGGQLVGLAAGRPWSAWRCRPWRPGLLLAAHAARLWRPGPGLLPPVIALASGQCPSRHRPGARESGRPGSC